MVFVVLSNMNCRRAATGIRVGTYHCHDDRLAQHIDQSKFQKDCKRSHHCTLSTTKYSTSIRSTPRGRQAHCTALHHQKFLPKVVMHCVRFSALFRFVPLVPSPPCTHHTSHPSFTPQQGRTRRLRQAHFEQHNAAASCYETAFALAFCLV